MASFNNFIPTLSANEGGYQAMSQDPGNYNSNSKLVGTNHGISAPVLETYLGYPPTAYDMKNLSLTTANQIFKKLYWDVMKGDYIKDQAVAETIIDHGINAGTKTAIKIAQRVLNNSFGNNLTVDGVIGNLTLIAINSVNAKSFFIKYNEARAAYYRSLTNFSTFGNSWLNRIQVISNKFKIFLATSSSGSLPAIIIIAALVGGYILIKKN